MSSYLSNLETSKIEVNKELKVKNNIIDVKGKISGFPYGGYIRYRYTQRVYIQQIFH